MSPLNVIFKPITLRGFHGPTRNTAKIQPALKRAAEMLALAW